jgi:hypothetical protein
MEEISDQQIDDFIDAATSSPEIKLGSTITKTAT